MTHNNLPFKKSRTFTGIDLSATMSKQRRRSVLYALAVPSLYVLAVVAVGVATLVYVHVGRDGASVQLRTVRDYSALTELDFIDSHMSYPTRFLRHHVYNGRYTDVLSRLCSPARPDPCVYPIGHTGTNATDLAHRHHGRGHHHFDRALNAYAIDYQYTLGRYVITETLNATNHAFLRMGINPKNSSVQFFLGDVATCSRLVYDNDQLPTAFINNTLYKYEVYINDYNSGCCVSNNLTPSSLFCYVYVWGAYATSGLFVFSFASDRVGNATADDLTVHDYYNASSLMKFAIRRVDYPATQNMPPALYPTSTLTAQGLYDTLVFSNPYNARYMDHPDFPFPPTLLDQIVQKHMDGHGLIAGSTSQPSVPSLFYSYLIQSGMVTPFETKRDTDSSLDAVEEGGYVDIEDNITGIVSTLPGVYGIYKYSQNLITYDVGPADAASRAYHTVPNSNVVVIERYDDDPDTPPRPVDWACIPGYFGVECQYSACLYFCPSDSCKFNDEYVACGPPSDV